MPKTALRDVANPVILGHANKRTDRTKQTVCGNPCSSQEDKGRSLPAPRDAHDAVTSPAPPMPAAGLANRFEITRSTSGQSGFHKHMVYPQHHECTVPNGAGSPTKHYRFLAAVVFLLLCLVVCFGCDPLALEAVLFSLFSSQMTSALSQCSQSCPSQQPCCSQML